MLRTTPVIAMLLSSFALAAEAPSEAPCVEGEAQPSPVARSAEWSDTAHFFGGVRLGVNIPPGGHGVAPTQGFELGVSNKKGFGFGLHIITVQNPPDVPALNIPKADWAVGALADLRMYFQTVDPLTLYATLSAGFVAGPGQNGAGNAVLPMLNPGFGARVKPTDSTYIAFEFGLAGFYIPFVTMSFGWEPVRKPTPKGDVSS
jgi:hypothetical protein